MLLSADGAEGATINEREFLKLLSTDLGQPPCLLLFLSLLDVVIINQIADGLLLFFVRLQILGKLGGGERQGRVSDFYVGYIVRIQGVQNFHFSAVFSRMNDTDYKYSAIVSLRHRLTVQPVTIVSQVRILCSIG